MTQTSDSSANEHALPLQGKSSSWKWLLLFFGVFLPVILLALYSLSIASDSVEKLVEEENISAAGNLSQLITQDVRQNIKLAHAVASIPGTVSAVRTQDEVAMQTRLKAIMVSNPQLHRAFVVGTGGVLWAEFPKAQGAYGAFFGDWSWFYSVKETQRPYISGLYIRPQYPDEPVIALAVPIRDSGDFIGVLVFEYQVQHLSKWLQNVRLGLSGHMFLVDQYGSLVAHPSVSVGGALFKDYMGLDVVERAHRGDLFTTRYEDPVSDDTMVATFVPIAMGSNRWVAIAQQPTREAFSILDQIKHSLGIAGIILALFTLVMIIMLARMSAKTVHLNEQLAAKNQALKDFTSIVSHQLKAPITAMRWNLEMILGGDFGNISDELRSVIAELHEVNVSNYHLVMDILNVSRLDRGVVAVDVQPISVRELVERAVRDYRSAAENAGLYLKIETPDDLVVKADLEKAAEAITNSISNALKYTKEGGITVRAYQKDSNAIIEVVDTGAGMSEDMLSKLFTRSGVSKANAKAEHSSGLGLYIAREFMKMQGGDIQVTSKEGQGTTFTYTLPLDH